VLCASTLLIWGLVWIWRNYRIKADLQTSAKIFASSLIASGVAFLVISQLSLPYWLLLIAGFSVFLLVYLVTAPLFGAVNQMDIVNFQTMFSGLGVVSKVLNLPLKFMRKLCRGASEKKSLDIQPEDDP
jgi:hypothetical protein